MQRASLIWVYFIFTGRGTKADKQEALKWLQLSAGQGFESAKTLLTELQ
jgi:TPR repeat protein